MSDVAQILGQPTDQNQYVTGKAFSPWYFGDDVSRIEWHVARSSLGAIW